MADFWKLVQNENMKIYRRARTWIMFGFIILLPPIISLILLLATSDENTSGWFMMWMESMLLFFLITIFTVVIASETVAGEFSWGTIKLLLIRPWSRSAVLLSKFIAMLLFALTLTVVTFAVTLLVNMAIFGSASGIESIPYQGLAAGNSEIEIMLQFYLFQFISLILIVSFGFMMSSAFRSSGLAIGLSITMLFAGSLITGIFALADKVWVKYVLFMHLDLTPYMNGGVPIQNHPTTLGFSLSVLAVYFILFNLISWVVFSKRDITA